MQNTTKIIATVAVIAALVLSVLAYWKAGSAPAAIDNAPAVGATFSTNAPTGNSALGNGTILPNPSTFDYLVARAYAFVTQFGLDNGTSVGTNIRAARSAIVATSSVLCSVANPLGATSSITHAAIIFTTAPTSTLSLVVGTSSASGGRSASLATSSGMQTASITVSATNTVVAWDGGSNNDVIGPNETINWGVGGASATAGSQYAPGGACSATFVSDN